MERLNVSLKPASRTFIRKMFFSVVYVMMLTAIISTLVVLVQGICIQNFMGSESEGDVATGAEGLAMPIFAFGTFFCYAFGFGLQILASRHINSEKRSEIPYYFTANMILSLAAVILFLIIGTTLSKPIAELLGAGDGTGPAAQAELKYCAQCIKGYFIGFIFQCLFRSFHPSIYLDNAKKYAYAATAAMVVTTIAGFLLIGYFAPIETKMFWFGFMTTSSYSGGIFVFLIYFIVRNKNALFKFQFKGLKAYHFGHLFKFGTPTGLRKLSFALYVLVLNLILGAVDPSHIGIDASSTLIHYQTLLVVVSSGIYYSCSTMASYFTGLKDKKCFDELLRLITIICFAFMPIISIIFIVLAEPLVMAYGTGANNPVLYSACISSIRWYAAALPFITIGGVWLSVYQGANNNKWMYASIIWQDFFPLCFVALFGFLGKLVNQDVARYMLWVGQFFGPIAVLIFHFFLGWIVNKGKPFSSDAFFFLEKKKLYDEKSVLRSNFATAKEQEMFKDKLHSFARLKKFSASKENAIYDFIYKLNNCLANGDKLNVKFAVGVRIAVEDNQIIISYADSRRHFITKKTKIDRYEQKIKRFKLKYKDMFYASTFNFNEFCLVLDR